MKNGRLSAYKLARIAIVATLYIGATLAVAPLAFGPIQFRFSEILVLLCFYNPEFCFSMILGCFISNLYSPLTYYDLIFGVTSTVFTVAGIYLVGKYKPFGKLSLWISSLFASVSMIFIAWELMLLGEPFWLSLLTTFIGEFVVVTVIGCPIFKQLEKNEHFIEYIKK